MRIDPRFSLIIVGALLVIGALALSLQGEPTPTPERPSTPAAESRPAPKRVAPSQDLVLTLSWEPAFCETSGGRPECRTLTAERFDATNFVLHGLWPEAQYCGVSAADEAADGAGRWSDLPTVRLSAATRKLLDKVMPGSRSLLDRHEWISHGTCYGTDADSYFRDAALLLAAFNASPVRDLFADSIGRQVTRKRLRAAADTVFGKGAGARIRLDCEPLAGRTLITEIKLKLHGRVGENPDLGALLLAASPYGAGCDGGIVDDVGPR